LGELGYGDISGWSCWDLGAHFGIYSIALAVKAGPAGQVAAFEPNPNSFERLERHRRMNRLSWLKTYQAAASDHSGSAELLTYGAIASTDSHLRYEGETPCEASQPILIRCLRLDDLVDRGELRAPQFVKVDVEGHGHKALEGMKRSTAASRPVMMFAFHSQLEIDGVIGILEPLGYRWTQIGGIPSSTEPQVGNDYLFRPDP
jgi:FkbM family methyltransferase